MELAFAASVTIVAMLVMALGSYIRRRNRASARDEAAALREADARITEAESKL